MTTATKPRSKSKTARKPKATPKQPPKKKGGRQPIGEAARAIRWEAIASQEEDAMLQTIAARLADGNKAQALRKSIRMIAQLIQNNSPLPTLEA